MDNFDCSLFSMLETLQWYQPGQESSILIVKLGKDMCEWHSQETQKCVLLSQDAVYITPPLNISHTLGNFQLRHSIIITVYLLWLTEKNFFLDSTARGCTLPVGFFLFCFFQKTRKSYDSYAQTYTHGHTHTYKQRHKSLWPPSLPPSPAVLDQAFFLHLQNTEK